MAYRERKRERERERERVMKAKSHASEGGELVLESLCSLFFHMLL